MSVSCLSCLSSPEFPSNSICTSEDSHDGNYSSNFPLLGLTASILTSRHRSTEETDHTVTHPLDNNTQLTHLVPRESDTAAPGSDTCRCSSRPARLRTPCHPPDRSWPGKTLSSRRSTPGGRRTPRGLDTARPGSSAGWT